MSRNVWLVVLLWAGPAWAALEVSPSFLGMYRKTIEIDNALVTYTARYGVDPRTARAVVLQESGGNAHLISPAGAQGYFQVMPQTFRMLKVRSNIEAGIKYLAQLNRQLGREDYAIAAYNAGPGAVGKQRPLRLETLQYVIGVGHYKSVLRLYEPEVRRQAEKLKLWRVQRGDSWETIAQTTKVPLLLLRLYNPFLAIRPLQAGAVIAYPEPAPGDVLEYEGEDMYYTSRIGDSYLHLANVFGIDLETFRLHNDLWRLQQLPVGLRLRVSRPPTSPVPQSVIASQPKTMRTESVTKQQKESSKTRPTRVRTHKVRRGDTLAKIARRYRTTVQALKRANGLRSAHIRVGTSLSIPSK